MKTVILTRPLPAMAKAKSSYQEAGFEVFEAPCFDIQSNQSVQTNWLQADADVWIVLSVHALQHALLLVPEFKPSKNTQVIAVGPAVVKAWQKVFNHPITSHPLMSSEGVIELLKQRQPRSVKILTTGEGRHAIKSYCMDHAISYSQINTYQRVPLAIDQIDLRQIYSREANGQVILTATSGGILQHFVTQCDAELLHQVLKNPLIVGSSRIAELARSLGFTDILIAENPSDQAMCAAAVN